MELLGLVLVVVGFVLVCDKVLKVGPRRRRYQRPPLVRPAPERRAPAVTRSARPPHFDDASAQHLSHKHIVAGAAYVVDGDTIKIKNTQIRLFGIDAPELNHPYGNKAKWALVKLCKGHVIQAEVTDRDVYGRLVARCRLSDGRDLSAEMVKQGLAIDWPKFSGGRYRTLETPDARKRMFLADARQKGRMHVWRAFEARQERS